MLICRSFETNNFLFNILSASSIYLVKIIEFLIFPKSFFMDKTRTIGHKWLVNELFLLTRDRLFSKNRFFWLWGFQNVKIWWKFRKSFFTWNHYLLIDSFRQPFFNGFSRQKLEGHEKICLGLDSNRGPYFTWAVH